MHTAGFAMKQGRALACIKHPPGRTGKKMDAIAKGMALVRPLVSRHKGMLKPCQGRHLIIFREPAADEILVIRVLHDRMDIDSWLQG